MTMNATKNPTHSPGPWMVDDDDSPWAVYSESTGRLVCDAVGNPNSAQAAIDMRLVSAAPQMYAALGVLLDAARALLAETGGVEPAGIRMAQSALDKAEGRLAP